MAFAKCGANSPILSSIRVHVSCGGDAFSGIGPQTHRCGIFQDVSEVPPATPAKAPKGIRDSAASRMPGGQPTGTSDGRTETYFYVCSTCENEVRVLSDDEVS